jgi:hypothetical protein
MIRPLAIMALCSVSVLAAGLGETGPVLVELFTAEGCSNCPAADRIMERLERNPNVILLGEHVDYLDTTGWADRFASPLFTTRQQDYANSLHLNKLYTPQVVVNGEKDVSGFESRTLDVAISAAMRSPRAPVNLRWSGSNVLLSVGKLPPNSHKADVLLAIAENGLESQVLAGQNAGRKLRHAAIVRSLVRIAEVDPAKPGEYVADLSLNLRPEWVRGNLKVVVFVQDRDNRRVLGAASLR